MSAIQKKANDEYFKAGGGPLFPGTFVSLPISRYPSDVSSFLTYSWYRFRQWGFEYISLLQMKLKSMPNWTTRPKWKIARGKIAPTAKNMYMEMLGAFAAGDKAAINELCLGQFGKKLIAAIDRRNPAEVVTFELVKLNKTLVYPRVMGHQVHNINPHDKDHSTEQAIVAIASTQRVTKLKKATGEIIPGSTKVQDKLEYVVLSRQISEKTFQAGHWRIWGTISPTTLESFKAEEDWINREQAKRAGWDGPTK
ncbi:tim44-like domain-containing protein [Fusarium austroafricanum]|uniref:Large ribosomal subunit protein mL45 n=1 Tax=Fusarium austroafricanum TaxID=2364996 RepID=A0A8H4NIQ5_9HYPO|nr:tim44-like domain-containing protein [Fusarium austroafricanum]